MNAFSAAVSIRVGDAYGVSTTSERWTTVRSTTA
jgi:hypothetical protein